MTSKRAEYTARINRVMDHIDRNLSEDLTLEVLAREANLSPYHFHRIFHAMVGETLRQFVGRLRLERAASRLLAEPDLAVTNIALDLGFSSPSTFARSFKAHFGVSASAWRQDRKNCKALRKPRQPLRNPGEAGATVRAYPASTTNPYPRWEVTMKEVTGHVEIVERTPTKVAYIRHVGPYQGDHELFGRLFSDLMRWAGAHGLMGNPQAEVMCVYHDDPNVTEPEHLRVSVCITAREDTEPGGEVNLMTMEGGQYARAAFKLRGDEYAAAWQMVYGSWLPESGFVPGDGPSFEVYASMGPDEEGYMDVLLYVPVKPID